MSKGDRSMIVAVYGSPRKEGNTEILTDHFLKPLLQQNEVKRIYLRDLTLKPCVACGGCDKTGVCVFKDDIWSLYEEIEKSDALVLASPIFFASVSAQVKAFIDRAQPFWVRKYVFGQKQEGHRKKGFFLSVGAIDTYKFFLNARLVFRTLMNTLDIDYSGDLFFPAVDRKGEIREKPGALEAAEKAGLEWSLSIKESTVPPL